MPRESGEHGTISPRKPRPLDLPTKHSDLMTKHEDLSRFATVDRPSKSEQPRNRQKSR